MFYRWAPRWLMRWYVETDQWLLGREIASMIRQDARRGAIGGFGRQYVLPRPRFEALETYLSNAPSDKRDGRPFYHNCLFRDPNRITRTHLYCYGYPVFLYEVPSLDLSTLE